MHNRSATDRNPSLKRRSIITGLGAAGVGALAGCLSNDNNETAFRIGGRWELDRDPLDGGSELRRLGITEPLVSVDYDANLAPGLATEWQRVEDTRWEFTLREEVTFHDGEPLDAAAAVESLRRTVDLPDFTDLPIETVEAVDEMTVAIETTTAFSPLPAHLSRSKAVIVSPDVIDAEGSASDPVSTGPFVVEHLDPRSELRAVRNDEYHGSQPDIEAIRYEVVQDAQTRRLKLENGEIEMARGLPHGMVSSLQDTDGVDVYTPEIPRIRFLTFDTQSEPFDDARVRRAVDHGVDRTAITESVLDGVDEPAVAPFSPETSDWGNPDLERDRHDLDQARSLLSEAGWTREGDQNRTRDGDELTVELLTFDARSLPLIGQVLQDQLASIGIGLEMTVMEYSAMDEQVSQEPFDSYLTSWATLWYPDPDRLSDMFHSDGALLHHGYDNERVDTLLEEARELDDLEARQDRYHEVQSLVLDDAPISVLTDYTNVVATANKVSGYQPHPLQYRYGLDAMTLEES